MTEDLQFFRQSREAVAGQAVRDRLNQPAAAPSCATCYWKGREQTRCGVCVGPTGPAHLNHYRPKD